MTAKTESSEEPTTPAWRHAKSPTTRQLIGRLVFLILALALVILVIRALSG